MNKTNKMTPEERRAHYMIETVKEGRRDNLSMSWDYDTDASNVTERHAVMLYTPDMEDTSNHEHIEFSDEEAKKLHSWLGRFLEMKGIK